MLDAYIIDAIRREEEARARAEEGRRVRLEIPVYRPEMGREDEPRNRNERQDPYAPEEDEEVHDGPIVIPLNPPNRWGEEDAA